MKRFFDSVVIGLRVAVIVPLAIVMTIAAGVSAFALFLIALVSEGAATVIQRRLREKNGEGPATN